MFEKNLEKKEKEVLNDIKEKKLVEEKVSVLEKSNLEYSYESDVQSKALKNC